MKPIHLASVLCDGIEWKIPESYPTHLNKSYQIIDSSLLIVCYSPLTCMHTMEIAIHYNLQEVKLTNKHQCFMIGHHDEKECPVYVLYSKNYYNPFYCCMHCLNLLKKVKINNANHHTIASYDNDLIILKNNRIVRHYYKKIYPSCIFMYWYHHNKTNDYRYYICEGCEQEVDISGHTVCSECLCWSKQLYIIIMLPRYMLIKELIKCNDIVFEIMTTIIHVTKYEMK